MLGSMLCVVAVYTCKHEGYSGLISGANRLSQLKLIKINFACRAFQESC